MPPVKQPEATAPKAGEHNPAVNDLLAFANTLRAEKESVYERINANREVLRSYKKMGLLSAEQATAVDEFYPMPKPRKGKDDSGNGATA